MSLWKIAILSISILGGIAGYVGYQHANSACDCGASCPCGADCPCGH